MSHCNRLDLDLAVAEGIVSRDQAVQLRDLARRTHGDAIEAAGESAFPLDFTQDPRDEPFRLLRGFRDVFIAISLVIFAGGLTGLSFALLVDFDFKHQTVAALSLVFPLVLLGLGYLMAELITRRHRLPLSSMIVALAVGFWAGWLGVTGMATVVAVAPGTDLLGPRWMKMQSPWAAHIGALAGLALFYWRYRLPFTLLPIAGVCVVLLLLGAAEIMWPSWPMENFKSLTIVFGTVVFVVAMWFDRRDRLRVTRLSECAFWLHLLAAPLMVHGVLSGGTFGPLPVLATMAVLCIVALLIDRRALLVSGIGYLASAIWQLLQTQIFFDNAMGFVSTAAILGGVLTLLGLGWTPLRRYALTRLPLGRLADLLPPVAAG